MATAAVVTISDSCARGERDDLSGPKLAEALANLGFEVMERRVVPDDEEKIENCLIEIAARVRLIVTTGGTGIARRDVTPEVTRRVCERILEGFAEVMRAAGLKQTPFAALSRAVSGSRGSTLIVNVPGNPQGAVVSLHAVAHLLPHALDLLAGKTAHDRPQE